MEGSICPVIRAITPFLVSPDRVPALLSMPALQRDWGPVATLEAPVTKLSAPRSVDRQALEEGARALVGAGAGDGAHVGELQPLAGVGVDQHRLERPAVAAIDEIHRLAAARGRT